MTLGSQPPSSNRSTFLLLRRRCCRPLCAQGSNHLRLQSPRSLPFLHCQQPLALHPSQDSSRPLSHLQSPMVSSPHPNFSRHHKRTRRPELHTPHRLLHMQHHRACQRAASSGRISPRAGAAVRRGRGAAGCSCSPPTAASPCTPAASGARSRRQWIESKRGRDAMRRRRQW